jgi:hypothetical protein
MELFHLHLDFSPMQKESHHCCESRLSTLEYQRSSSLDLDQLNTVSSVLSMVVGHNSAQAVWKTLEHRFTSTSRANVLNLKIELHNLKKGTESISSYLQKVKNTRDKLVAVGTLIDNEELLHIILKGLPREYGPFCSAIRTRNEPVSFEEIMVLLQTEEQSSQNVLILVKICISMAMFASAAPNNRNSNSQSSFYVNNSQSRGRGRNNSQRGRGGRFNTTISTLRITIHLITVTQQVLSFQTET